jgi:hypothetical protein
MHALAQTAHRFAAIQKRGRKQRLSANATKRSRQRPYCGKTNLAHWKPGNFNQRGLANAAIGGEKSEK